MINFTIFNSLNKFFAETLGKDKLNYRWNYYSFLLLAFIIPLHHRLLPPALLFCFITSFFNFKFKSFSLKKSLPLLIYFIVIVLGYFYSANVQKALFEIELNLSFLLLPILFSISNLNFRSHKISILKSFIDGVLVSILLSALSIGINYSKVEGVSDILYSNSSYFHHTSYMAMYCTFAIIIIWYLYLKNPAKIGKELFVFYQILFSIFTVLLMSKSGILILAIVQIYYLYKWVRLTHKWKLLTLIISVSLGSFLLLYLSSNWVQHRLNDVLVISSNPEEVSEHSSTGVRLLAWKTSIEVIKERPILGYGTGDFENELAIYYMNHQYYRMSKAKINAHNQYLQSLGKSGIFGLLILVLLLVALIYYNKSEVSVLLCLLLAINWLTEAMLQTQSGIAFTVFFVQLFLAVDYKKPKLK